MLFLNTPALQEEAARLDFFLILQHLVNELEQPYLDLGSVELLSQLAAILKEKESLRQYFTHVICNASFLRVMKDFTTKKSYLSLMARLYREDLLYFNSIYDVESIIGLFLMRFNSANCCSEHGLLIYGRPCEPAGG